MKKTRIILTIALMLQLCTGFGARADVVENGTKAGFSTIEKMYNNSNQGKFALKQFGYDTFNSMKSLSASRVSPDYKLNSGDKINVFFWGDSIDLIAITGNSFLRSTGDVPVDNEGNLFVPGVGIIPAKGRTTKEVENQISSSLSGKFADLKVKVTLSAPDSFPVVIMGNVRTPGRVNANGSSTLLDLLIMAGGVSKDGSLRNITYINSSDKSKTNIDMYELLIKGSFKSIRFKEGDVILVKPIGKVIGLKEGVKNPAIFEFKAGESLKDIIGYAGGFLPSVNQKNLLVESFDLSAGQKKVIEVKKEELGKLNPKDGDVLSFKGLYDQPENIISLEGNIKHPGSFEYKKGMKLSEVLKSKDELLAKTFTDQAVIERITGVDRHVVSIPVSLVDFFNGYENPDLMPMDKIKIYPSTSMETVEVSGCVKNPGLIPYKNGMTIRTLLGSVELGSESGINYVNSGTKPDFKTSNIVVEITNPNEKNLSGTRTVYLYDLLTKNDLNINTVIQPGDKVLFRSVEKFESPRTVSILGYVNNPGVYSINRGMKIKDAINLAGGLSPDGYLKGLVLLRPMILEAQKKEMQKSMTKLQEDILIKSSYIQASNPGVSVNMKEYLENQKGLLELLQEKASENYGRISINIKTSDINQLSEDENIELSEGDEIFIPFMSSHVLVMGEVLNQTALAYKPGRTVKYYINNVGGTTNQADKGRIIIVKANGISKKVQNQSTATLEPGDAILVPKKVRIPINWMALIKDVAQTISSTLSTVYVMTKI